MFQTRIEWVEYLVAQQFGLEVKQVRELVWRNLAAIIHQTGTSNFFPEPIAAVLPDLNIPKE
jgi:hypothetical protein